VTRPDHRSRLLTAHRAQPSKLELQLIVVGEPHQDGANDAFPSHVPRIVHAVTEASTALRVAFAMAPATVDSSVTERSLAGTEEMAGE
jgi:hypothetical protein